MKKKDRKFYWSKKQDPDTWLVGPEESVDRETRRYLKRWRRQDRKQRGDWTWGDLWRWIKGGMK